jgi:hypothetical protein
VALAQVAGAPRVGRAPVRRAPYVLTGAVLGAAVAGGLAVRQAARCDACFFKGAFVAVSIGAGAAVGSLVGLAASQVARVNAPRYRADSTSAP